MSRGGVIGNLESDSARQWRFGALTRKGVLVVHIVSAGAWIGIDVVMAVFVFTALGTGDNSIKALCFRALELFAVWPLVVTGLICLASGVILGLGTKWGIIRYWWVAIKLVMNVILVVLVIFALRPGVIELAERGRRFVAGEPASLVADGLIFPPVVSTSALIVATVLAEFKPWGRIRTRRKLKRGPVAAPDKDDGTSDFGAYRDAYPSRDNGKEVS